MLKKIMLCVLIGGFFNLIPFDEPQAETLHNYYFRIQGGVQATSSQLEQGDVWGTVKAEFLRPVYKDMIAIGGTFENIKNADEDWRKYGGRAYFFSRTIEKDRVSKPGSGGGLSEENKAQLYLFTGLGGTHESGGSFAEGSYCGGVGLMFPLLGATTIVEFEASQMKKDWFFGLTAGWQIGLDF